MDSIKAILWDNDGILVDTEHTYFDVTRTVLAEAGVQLSSAQYRELFMKASKGAWHFVSEKGYSDDEVELFRSRRNKLYTERLHTADFAIEGVEEVLQTLHGRYRMACVTSSRRAPFEAIHRRTGFMKYFEFALVREDYSESKPDPEPYLTAVEQLGVRKEHCLIIEDTERGLCAAVAAGIRCWVIPRGMSVESDFSAAEKVLGSIREVPTVLAE